MSFPSKIGLAPLSAVKLEGTGKFHHKVNIRSEVVQLAHIAVAICKVYHNSVYSALTLNFVVIY